MHPYMPCHAVQLHYIRTQPNTQTNYTYLCTSLGPLSAPFVFFHRRWSDGGPLRGMISKGKSWMVQERSGWPETPVWVEKWATAQECSSRLTARNHLSDFQARLSYQVPFPACHGFSEYARMIPGCALQARCNGVQPMAVIASMALLPQPRQSKGLNNTSYTMLQVTSPQWSSLGFRPPRRRSNPLWP